MRITKTISLLLLSGAASATLMAQAQALEAQAFVDRLEAVYEVIGYNFDFGDATLDGDTVTVAGGTLSLLPVDGDEGSHEMSFDTTITFTGVTEGEDGSYMAETVTIPDIDVDFEEDDVAGHVSLADIRVDGLYLPAGDPVPATGLLQLFKSFSTGPLSLEREGTEVFSFASVESNSTFNPEFGTAELTDVKSIFDINDMTVDLTTLGEEDPAAAANVEALGLTTINANLHMDIDWSMADGRMVVNDFLLDAADVGKLNIRSEITGFTPEVLDQIYAMQASMKSGDDEVSEEQAQAQMMQGLALLQNVNVVSASIRYDDASFANKLLDQLATQNGASDKQSFVDGLKATLPALVAQTGIEALNDLVVPPVSAFLDDPQSLEIKVAPPSPTSVLVLAAAAANPAGLISALGLAVESNTAE